jgi:Domain of unknown function (DUF1772)
MLQTSMEFIAALSCALFAGAAVYINAVEHPARMSCGSEAAAAEWAPSYKRATWMQVPLAVVGFVCAVVAWLVGSSSWWLIGGVLLGLVVPFTLVVIMPTNKRLLSSHLDKRSEETRRLLVRWNRLHSVRTALALWHSSCSWPAAEAMRAGWHCWSSTCHLSRRRDSRFLFPSLQLWI